jgi:K+/H+ antiporter YhaU regulatory subunit KhtT
MAEKYSTPVYSQIALDLAKKIAGGEIATGSKLSGRSLLSSTYRVSPETIRRAMHLLEDMDITRSEPKSGYVIVSREKAARYVERFDTLIQVRSAQQEIETLRQQKLEIETRIFELVDYVARQADRLNRVKPLYPYEIIIYADSALVGMTISESKFWQYTGGTIVAIRRAGQVIYSPGPYAVYQADDVLLVAGDAGVEERAIDYVRQFRT